ncbi:DoxX family protein [Peterkaempfera sp. SMS 1(5)a]|uniref:DoxX family protein n=1 Tax=Peterkaempfera podocarpi TaxID=3232308 RepID=UPI00366C7947
MNVFLWIVAGVLAAVFMVAGAMKLSRTPEQLAASGPGWAADFGAGPVKLIGALEVLADLGLILPPLVGVGEILAPVAAPGLVVLMIGATVTHGRRREFQMITVNVVLLALAAVVARGRFGPHVFSVASPPAPGHRQGEPARGHLGSFAVRSDLTGVLTTSVVDSQRGHGS